MGFCFGDVSLFVGLVPILWRVQCTCINNNNCRSSLNTLKEVPKISGSELLLTLACESDKTDYKSNAIPVQPTTEHSAKLPDWLITEAVGNGDQCKGSTTSIIVHSTWEQNYKI